MLFTQIFSIIWDASESESSDSETHKPFPTLLERTLHQVATRFFSRKYKLSRSKEGVFTLPSQISPPLRGVLHPPKIYKVLL